MTQSPTQEWLEKIIKEIVPEHFLPRLEDDREIDFSYFLEVSAAFVQTVFSNSANGVWPCATWPRSENRRPKLRKSSSQSPRNTEALFPSPAPLQRQNPPRSPA